MAVRRIVAAAASLAVFACPVAAESPGQRFEVRPRDMPAPYATSSASKGSPWPFWRWPNCAIRLGK